MSLPAELALLIVKFVITLVKERQQQSALISALQADLDQRRKRLDEIEQELDQREQDEWKTVRGE